MLFKTLMKTVLMKLSIFFRDGETPLHVAIRLEYLSIAKLLLQKGANSSSQSNFGSVMEYCSRCDNPDVRGLMEGWLYFFHYF